jgi:deazaflavin-dependent oxidoreductase (nitroreductase family)
LDEAAMSDWNTKIIEEYRATGGNLGGQFAGAPLLLLHSTGAKSGQDRVAPVMYLSEGDDLVVFASKAGAETNPDWFHNLKANPETRVEVGAETVAVRARIAEGEERDRLFDRQKAAYPGFADYEAGTHRIIPVVVLERV